MVTAGTGNLITNVDIVVPEADAMAVNSFDNDLVSLLLKKHRSNCIYPGKSAAAG